MITPEIDEVPYFQIIHALVREDGSTEELDRTNLVAEWLQRGRYAVEKVCNRKELGLLGVIIGHWTKFRQCPSREILEQQIKSLSKSKDLLTLLYRYDKFAPDLSQRLTHADMDFYLAKRTTEYEKVRLLRILENAIQITVGSMDNVQSTQKNPLPPLEGTKDALTYVMQNFQKGVLVDDVRAEGGPLSEHVGRIREVYDQRRKDLEDGKLWIPTGIPLLDRNLGGCRRKEVWGVLGYTGQRKSAIVRTIAYMAAKAGFRVLHIPLESDFIEELTSYSVMHAHATRNPILTSMSRRRFDGGTLTDEEYTEFMDNTVANFRDKVGDNLIVYDPKAARTWPEIKGVIERENYIHPLDLVIVDYLTLIGDPKDRDQVVAKTLMIQDAKQMTLASNFCLITPLQGSRNGYEDATDHDGAWDITGISTFSEFDKTLDTCLYVFTNEALSLSDRLKLGSCKNRRGPDIPATEVLINNDSGLILGEDVASGKSLDIEIMESVPKASSGEIRDELFDYIRIS